MLYAVGCAVGRVAVRRGCSVCEVVCDRVYARRPRSSEGATVWRRPVPSRHSGVKVWGVCGTAAGGQGRRHTAGFWATWTLFLEPGIWISIANVQPRQLSEHHAGYFRSFLADYQIHPAATPAFGLRDMCQSAPGYDTLTVYHWMPQSHSLLKFPSGHMAVGKQSSVEVPSAVAPLDWLQHLEVFVECKHGFVMVDQ